MEEVWKSVDGFCEYYEVSNLGRVRSLPRYRNCRGGGKAFMEGRILSTSISRKGYERINFYVDGKQTYKEIHRLVAESFVEKVDGKYQVNHIDGNKLNNIPSNLEWVTNSENAIHAFKLGLRVPRSK